MKYTLHYLGRNGAGEGRWSIVGAGPVAYLTCPGLVAQRIYAAVRRSGVNLYEGVNLYKVAE